MADILDDRIKKDLENRKTLVDEGSSKYMAAKKQYLLDGELTSIKWTTSIADLSEKELKSTMGVLEAKESKLVSAINYMRSNQDVESAKVAEVSLAATRNDIDLVRSHVSGRGAAVQISGKGKTSVTPVAMGSTSSSSSPIVSIIPGTSKPSNVTTTVSLRTGSKRSKVTAAIPESSASRMSSPSVPPVNKRISLQEAVANSNKTAAELLIPVKLVRTPGEFPSSSGGKYFDQHAVSIQTLQGKHLDYIQRDWARDLPAKLPEGFFAKVVPGTGEDAPFISLLRSVGGKMKKSGLPTRSIEHGISEGAKDVLHHIVSDQLSEMHKEPLEIPTAASVEPPRPRAKSAAAPKIQAKTKSRAAAPHASPKVTAPKATTVVPKIEVVPGSHQEFGGKNGNRLMLGISIAAGALLLWGASKQKGSQPLSVKDVQNSPYGANNISRTMAGQGFTPKVRLTPNNSGYATNIDVNTTDNSGNTDYRYMANTMGAISSASYGVNRSSTSLHIVDDSGRVDRESTRRSINQQLRD